MKTQTNKIGAIPVKAEAKYDNKYLGRIGGNLALAGTSVYLFDYWYDKVVELPAMQMSLNLTLVFLLALTYFVGKTYYTRGTINIGKQVITLLFMGVGVLALMYFAVKTEGDVIYPLSGVAIISIGFYMLALSAGTMGAGGILAMSLGFASLIMFANMFGYIGWNGTGELAQFGVFSVLFVGGTWSHISHYLFGVKGTQEQRGFGDAGDGDGDTAGE